MPYFIDQNQKFNYIPDSKDLIHYGMPRRSGRYPWGSGKDPYQSLSAKQKAALGVTYNKGIDEIEKGGDRSWYFREIRRLPKGTNVFRVTTSKSDDSRDDYTTVSYLEADRNLYKGGSIRTRDNKPYAHEHAFKLKDELKIASRREYLDSIKKVAREKPEITKEMYKQYYKEKISENSDEYKWIVDSSRKIDGSNLTPKEYFEEYLNRSAERASKVYDHPSNIDPSYDYMFRSATEAMGGRKSSDFKNAVIEDLKSKGFNAMVDEKAVGGGYGGREVVGADPLVLFDPSILESVGNRRITKEEEDESRRKYEEWKRASEKSNTRRDENGELLKR